MGFIKRAMINSNISVRNMMKASRCASKTVQRAMIDRHGVKPEYAERILNVLEYTTAIININQKKKLEEIAEAEGREYVDVLREAIELYLKKAP